jgi:5-methylcytosine-specific restriction endonuclease McrA
VARSDVGVPPKVTAPARPALVEPLAPSRYQVRFTASAELREKLERLQALMRSSVPDGDLARIIDIAVSEKLQRVEARRFGHTKAPRRDLVDADTSPSSRHIPAAVKREVHARDGGRCAYPDRYGVRCARHHDLEFHHKHPFARGGDHSPADLTLMCRTHNTLRAEQDYGEDVMARFRAAASRACVPVDAYGDRIALQPRRISSAWPADRPPSRRGAMQARASSAGARTYA